MKKFILSLDQGTTGTTAILVDAQNLEVVAKTNQEFEQIFPKPSWVEHNLNDIWKTVEQTTLKVLDIAGVGPEQISYIGITNQRETTCAFKRNGSPLAHAIVWQDRRTIDTCETLKSQGHEDYFKKMAGLPLDPYFSGTKMKWLLDHNEEVKSALNNNELCFGTIDTFLLFKLTSGDSFSTEASNASRTLLMNLKTSSWDDKALDILGIPKDTLPNINDSFTHFGKTRGLSFLPDGIPITGILGDQQAALFGQAGFNKGDMKCTYGTGAFALLNTGEDIVYSDSGLLTTVAYKENGKTIYALEGSSFIAGAAVQWLRDKLQILESSPQVEELANQVSDLEQMEHIIFMPFFSGIGSPYWKPEAKGAILGITRDTQQAHIARACLEGVCLAINDLIDSFSKDTSAKIKHLKVDGGACANNLFMQIQANFSDLTIIRPKVIETTGHGAALAAALGSGEKSLVDLEKLWMKDSEFKAKNDQYWVNKKSLWSQYIKKLFL